MNLDWITNPLLLTITALAAYRLTRLWTTDTLPPLPRLRHWALNKLNPTNPLTELITCPWCIGFWIATACVTAASTTHYWYWLATPLAISTIIGFLASRDN